MISDAKFDAIESQQHNNPVQSPRDTINKQMHVGTVQITKNLC